MVVTAVRNDAPNFRTPVTVQAEWLNWAWFQKQGVEVGYVPRWGSALLCGKVRGGTCKKYSRTLPEAVQIRQCPKQYQNTIPSYRIAKESIPPGLEPGISSKSNSGNWRVSHYATRPRLMSFGA